jgi:hypothetical protein
MTHSRRSLLRARVRLVGWLAVAALVALAVGGPTGPTGVFAWAPLTLQVSCANGGTAAHIAVSASRQETDYRVDVANNAAFSGARLVSLDPGSLTAQLDVDVADYASGVWARWTADTDVVTRASVSCTLPTGTPAATAAATPTEAPTPTPVATAVPTAAPAATPNDTPIPSDTLSPSATASSTSMPAPTPSPTRRPSRSAAPTRLPSATPHQAVAGVTSRPHVTPPPTATLLPDGGRPDAFAWRIALLGLAAVLAISLLVTPPARARTRR